MQETSDKEYHYTFGATEWTTYMRYRPKYPQSLIELIKSHHEQYCNQYDLAHDVGSGCGIFVPALAQDLGFKHIHVSDPGPGNVKQSQHILSNWLANLRGANDPIRPGLTFSCTTGEAMSSCAAAHTVNMVTIMEAAHWMDGPPMMRSAAETLAPDGTLAMVSYCATPTVKRNVDASVALKKTIGAILGHVLKKTQSVDSSRAVELERSLRQGCTGLDWISIDDAVWTNVRRIRLRGKGRGTHPNDAYFTENEDHFAASGVKQGERYDHFEEGDDEASGWDVEVDHDWFRGYMTSMEDPEHVTAMSEYKELMDILKRDFPAGTSIPVDWNTDIILATRRSTNS